MQFNIMPIRKFNNYEKKIFSVNQHTVSIYDISHLFSFQHVKGEVYEVDDELLEVINRLENYPKVYDRRKVLIQMAKMSDAGDQSEESVLELECMLYLLPGSRPALMKLDRLEEFDANAPNAKPYHVMAFDKEKGHFKDGALPSPGKQN